MIYENPLRAGVSCKEECELLGKDSIPLQVERVEYRPPFGPMEIWLRIRSRNGDRVSERPANANDKRVLSAARRDFFSPWVQEPREVLCAGAWIDGGWFLHAVVLFLMNDFSVAESADAAERMKLVFGDGQASYAELV